MDPDFGLLDSLLAAGVISRREMHEIKSELTIFKRNQSLLKIIEQKHAVKGLTTALKKTNQAHLSNFLASDGVYDAKFGDEWPLFDEEEKTLNINQSTLVENIEPTELIEQLLAKAVITQRQYIVMTSLPNPIAKNELLIEFLTRASRRNYQLVIECLNLTGQTHIAEFLKKGGVICEVHVTINGNTETLETYETKIVECFLQMLNQRSDGDQTMIEIIQSGHRGVELIIVKRGGSIAFYFHCDSLEGLTYLHEIVSNGQFKAIVETIFNQLLASDDPVTVYVNWSTEDHERCKAFFLSDNSEEEPRCSTPQPIVQKDAVSPLTNVLEHRNLVEDTVCCICYNTYRDPRSLACLHTFCFKCIERCAEGKLPGQRISCPVCRKNLKIPVNGVCGFPKNTIVEKLVQEFGNPTEDNVKIVSCDVCLENSHGEVVLSISIAEKYCMECQQNMCKDCAYHHVRQKLCRHHEIISLKDVKDNELVKIKLEACDIHPRKPKNIYCIDCQTTICQNCFAETHKGHSSEDVRRAAEKIQNELKDYCDALTNLMDEIEISLKDSSHNLFMQHLSNVERDIEERSDKVKHIVDQHKSRLFEYLEVVKKRIIAEFGSKTGELENHTEGLKIFIKLAQDLKAKGSISDVTGIGPCLLSRAKVLQSEHHNLCSKFKAQAQWPDVELVPIDIDDLLLYNTGNLVGKIRVDHFATSSGTEQYYIFCEYEEDCLYKPKNTMSNVHRRSDKWRERRKSESESNLLINTNENECDDHSGYTALQDEKEQYAVGESTIMRTPPIPDRKAQPIPSAWQSCRSDISCERDYLSISNSVTYGDQKEYDYHSGYTPLQEELAQYADVASAVRRGSLLPSGRSSPISFQEPPPIPCREKLSHLVDSLSMNPLACEIHPSNVALQRRLRRGKFTEVWLGLVNQTRKVSVKTFTTEALEERPWIVKECDFFREADILLQLDHKNIVKLIGISSLNEPFSVITETASNGYLDEYIRDRNSTAIQFKDMISMLAQIASAMHHLETMHCIHRDLTIKSILVGDNNAMMLTNFHMARFLEQTTFTDVYELLQSPIKCRAPEVIESQRWSAKSDVWSFGIVIYQMITYGKEPYPGMNSSELMDYILATYDPPCPAGSNFDYPDKKLLKIMQCCWIKDPFKRPDFKYLDEFLSGFFAGRRSNDLMGYLHPLKYVTAVKGKKPVSGVAVSNSELFISRINSLIIETYNSSTYKQLKPILLSEKLPKFKLWKSKSKADLTKPMGLHDLTIFSKRSVLYAGDWNDRKIYGICIDSRDAIFTWQMETGEPSGFSVTREGNVLVSCFNECKIFEYTPEGGIIMEINVGCNNDGPRQAVQSLTCHLIVIHGNSSSGGASERVSVIDIYGNIVADTNTVDLQNPSHMIVDSKGHVLIVERERSRIILANQNLTSHRVLLNLEHNTQTPTRIHLNKASGHLYVGLTDGSVLIYEAKLLIKSDVDEPIYTGASEEGIYEEID